MHNKDIISKTELKKKDFLPLSTDACKLTYNCDGDVVCCCVSLHGVLDITHIVARVLKSDVGDGQEGAQAAMTR